MKNISFEDKPDVNPSQCHLGYKKLDERGPSSETYCIPCSGADDCSRICDFCMPLKISDPSALLNVKGCTEIRTVGGIEITEIKGRHYVFCNLEIEFFQVPKKVHQSKQSRTTFFG